MRPGLGLLVTMAVAGCSGLEAVEGGVVGIEVSVPGPDSLAVGESIQLGAKPLDKNGDSLATPVTWTSADAAASIDPVSGVLTGVSLGSARVQARVGSLSSTLITFAVVPPADTLAIPGDSILTASVATTLPALVTTLRSFNPDTTVPGHAVIYAITSPDPLVQPAPVVFTGNDQLADTAVTGSDGSASAAVRLIVGLTPPDSVVVEIRAQRIRGAVVPGSGQHFILRLTP